MKGTIKQWEDLRETVTKAKDAVSDADAVADSFGSLYSNGKTGDEYTLTVQIIQAQNRLVTIYQMLDRLEDDIDSKFDIATEVLEQ